MRSRTSLSASTKATPVTMRLKADAFLLAHHRARPCPRRSAASRRSATRSRPLPCVEMVCDARAGGGIGSVLLAMCAENVYAGAKENVDKDFGWI